jgi:hypothetical protein
MAFGKTFFNLGAVLAPVIAAIVTLTPDLLKRNPPLFIVEPPIVKVGEPVIIKAANEEADRDELLNVEFEKHLFENAGKPFKTNGNEKQKWRFNMKDHPTASNLLKPGTYRVRFGFSGEKLSEEQAVTFIKKEEDEKPTIPSPNPEPRDNSLIIIFIILIAGGIAVAIIINVGKSR